MRIWFGGMGDRSGGGAGEGVGMVGWGLGWWECSGGGG